MTDAMGPAAGGSAHCCCAGCQSGNCQQECTCSRSCNCQTCNCHHRPAAHGSSPTVIAG